LRAFWSLNRASWKPRVVQTARALLSSTVGSLLLYYPPVASRLWKGEPLRAGGLGDEPRPPSDGTTLRYIDWTARKLRTITIPKTEVKSLPPTHPSSTPLPQPVEVHPSKDGTQQAVQSIYRRVVPSLGGRGSSPKPPEADITGWEGFGGESTPCRSRTGRPFCAG
jgi:hypothetical protein